MSATEEAVILSAVRTPIGKFMGALSPLSAVELGAAALKATTESEENRLATVSDYLPAAKEWPDRWPLLTAIDVATGSLVVWDKRSSATLVEAVASSCAAPLVAPPTTINGRRYMDAGPHSGTSAQLAAGHDLVVVIAVTRSGPLGRGGGRWPVAPAGRVRLLRCGRGRSPCRRPGGHP